MKHPSEITAEELRQWLLDQMSEIVMRQSPNTIADSFHALAQKVDEALATYAWQHAAVIKSDKAP